MGEVLIYLFPAAGVVVGIYYVIKFMRGYGATLRYRDSPIFHKPSTKSQRITLFILVLIIFIASVVVAVWLINGVK